MAVVSLIDHQNRTDFFYETVLLNLKYWQTWLDEVNDTTIETLDDERNGIVRAILFALDLGEIAWPMTHQLVITFSPYMERRGHWGIWNNVLHRAIHIADFVSDNPGAINLSILLARLLSQQSHFKDACYYYRQTIQLARQEGDKYNEARACSNLGYYYAENGQWYRAEVLCCHALKIFEQIDSDHGRAHTENHLGVLYIRQHHWEQAKQRFEQACATWQTMGDKHGLMRGFINLGGLLNCMKRPFEALIYLDKALDQAQLTGDEITTGRIYTNMSNSHRLAGNFMEAVSYLKQAESIFQKSSNLTELARVWNEFGLTYSNQQTWAQADLYLDKSLKLWRDLSVKFEEVEVLLDMVEGETIRENWQKAADRLQDVEKLVGQYLNYGQYRHLQPRLAKYRNAIGSSAKKFAAV